MMVVSNRYIYTTMVERNDFHVCSSIYFNKIICTSFTFFQIPFIRLRKIASILRLVKLLCKNVESETNVKLATLCNFNA